MTNNSTRRMLGAAARGAILMAAAALGSAAVAQPSSGIDVSGRSDLGGVTRSRAIEIADLNLGNAQGQQRLDQRLRHTASYVCNGPGMLGTRPAKDYVRCYSDALAGARGMVAQRMASGDTSPIRVALR